MITYQNGIAKLFFKRIFRVPLTHDSWPIRAPFASLWSLWVGLCLKKKIIVPFHFKILLLIHKKEIKILICKCNDFFYLAF